ncbi:MAG: WD40 repeat domain-containing protein [Isosphaeraceae bacterium]|nr:WD40 repeat domain-containing protein [Isosphaeraceae bacterium]
MPFASLRLAAADILVILLSTTLSSSAAADEPPRAPEAARPMERWAIVIGVDRYEDPAIPTNRSAVSDALALKQRLETDLGWPADHILPIVDGGNLLPGRVDGSARRFAPTRENLDWAVKQWLPPRLKPGDLVLIYFAGHAVSLPASADAPPGSRGRDYLLPGDARSAGFDLTGWSLDAALDALPNRGENPILCWLDTSVVGRGAGLKLPADPTRSPQRLLDALARWPGTSAWISGGDRPLAESSIPGRPSAFLEAVGDALGTADRPATLLALLGDLRSNERLLASGFRAVGGVDPDWTLWGARFEARVRPNGDIVNQTGHADRVREIVVSADGRWAATASMDSTVKCWNTTDGSVLRVVSGFGDGVRSLALSHDGRRLAAGDGLGRVRFWSRRETNAAVASGPPPHPGPVDTVIFLPDGRGVVSLDLAEGRALYWDASDPDRAPRRPVAAPIVVAVAAPKRSTITSALADVDGTIHLIRPEGSVARTVRLQARATALAFSPDARELAWADEHGRSGRIDVAEATVVDSKDDPAGRVTWIRYGANRAMIRRSGRIVAIGDRPNAIVLPNEGGRLELSSDGRFLLFADDAIDGGLAVYPLDTPSPKPLELVSPPRLGITSAMIAPDGSRLLAGDAAGGLHGWSLADGIRSFAVEPNRARVGSISIAPDGRALIRISAPDGVAVVWEPAEGRARTIPGRWASGLFIDADRLVLCEAVESGGRLRVVEARTARVDPEPLPMPPSAGGGRSNLVYERLALSTDGRRLAGGTREGQAPAVAIWDLSRRQLLGSSRPEGLSLHGLAFDAKAARLAVLVDTRALIYTSEADGSIPAEPSQSVDLAEHDPAGTDLEATAAAWFPSSGASERLAIGSSGGRVRVWDPQTASLGRPLAGTLAGALRSLETTPSGRFLAAVGDDRSLRAWRIDEALDRNQPLRFDVVPSHDERINTVHVWPNSDRVLTGADDGRIRFWSLDSSKLLGTLDLITPKTPAPGGPAVEWICTTPGGLFDASRDGAEAVRWTLGEESRSLDQLADKGFYIPGLGAELAAGTVPPRPLVQPVDPPAISLEWSRRPDPKVQTVELVITLGEAGLPDVRLYQQGVPIATRDDFQPTADPKRWTTSVKLRSGENRFHVLAGRPDRVDGRSATLATTFAGPDSPSRLHILAVGISEYDRKALRYADDDARVLSEFLHSRGVSADGEPGVRALLVDREVTARSVEEQCRRIRDAVKNRPQDTVVVFLAGHTDVFEKRFCLLLPNYPFQADAPLLVASRAGDGRAAANPQAILPYGSIYTQLARLGALQRLVIVDACQAEAIASDPQVELIKRYLSVDSRKARTSYLFAARAGEAANEVSELGHGLLSYVVLRGMRAENLGPARDPFAGSDIPADADLDRDGTISTAELQGFVARALPVLANRYDQLVQRGSDDPPLADRATVRLRVDDANFPIIPIARDPAAPR